MTKPYDTTVARIAGNIASGLVERAGLDGISADHGELIAVLCVSVARAIVEETERTEPAPLVMATGQGRDDS